MTPITQHDFETQDGRRKIISNIYRLERKMNELELKLERVTQAEESLEHDQQGPEAY